MQPTTSSPPSGDTAEALLNLLASEFPEGSSPSLLPQYDGRFRARIEAPAGPVTLLVPSRTLAAFASSRLDNDRVVAGLRRFVRERLCASRLRPDVVTVWDYAEAT
jgi:hypothetical protein